MNSGQNKNETTSTMKEMVSRQNHLYKMCNYSHPAIRQNHLYKMCNYSHPANSNHSDGQVARASASGAADSGLIPRLAKPMALKLVFTASLLDAQH